MQNENKATGQWESKLSGDWLGRMLAGNTDSIKFTQQYFKNLEEYKKKEQEILDKITQQRKNVSKDQSDWLGNLFNTNENLEGAGKNRQKALENALKLDFSQFDKEGMESLGNKLNEWFSETDYKNTGKFNKQINEVNKLNQAWKDGDITSRAYKNSVDDIASTLSKLTGGQITTEEFAKMLKLPEFDVESANKTFSDVEEAQNTLKSKIADMGVAETPKQRLELAYDVIQDEKVPEEIKNKVAEFASDGEISDQELKLLLNLIAEIKDDDLENTVNEKIDKLSEEKNVTQKVAIKYAMQVDSASDYNQYLEELLGDANLAMDIQVHMDTNDLDLLKEDLKGIPPEKQVGIIVSAVNSGKYTPEQLQSFIQLLPEQKQIDVISSVKQSGKYTPEQLKQLINGLPNNVKKQINVSTPGADKSNDKLNQVNKNSGNKNKQVKTSAPGADNTISKEKQVDKNSGNKTKQVKTSAPGASSTANILHDINLSAKSKTVTITTIFKTIGKKVTDFFGGGYQPPVYKSGSAGGFSNISDTPQEASAMSSGFSGVSDSPTASASAPTPTTSAPTGTSGQVSAKSTGSFGSVLTSSTLATKISTSYKNVWNTLKYGINLFQELENRISRTQNNLDLLSEKMENAVGTKKISYLKTQNKLYTEQSKLQKTLFKDLNKERKNVGKKLKGIGFSINKQGNLTGHEETLLRLERSAESAEKRSSGYKGKSDRKKKSLEKSADKVKQRLDDAKKLTEEYLKIQYTEIPNAEKEWKSLQNSIKENNDEIEQLNFENKIYKEKNAIDELNNSIKQYNHYRERWSTVADRSQGDVKLKYLKKEADELKHLQYLNEKLHDQNMSQRLDYRSKLKTYGVKFGDYGQISNYDETLNKYQNSSSLEKVKKWMEEYQDILDAERDTNDLRQDHINDMQDLQNEIKKLDLDEKIKPFGVSVDVANSKIKKLQNNLDIISVKMEHAYGNDKLNLIKEQISLYEQLDKEQKTALENMKKEEEILKKELEKSGFKFNSTGEITNMKDALSKIENSGAYEYIKEVLEQWKDLHENEIPDADKSIEDFENSIEDAYKNQLEVTKDIESKISDMIKKQIEDRKNAIEKETDTIKKELEKRKKAHQDARKEADYQNEYDEKTSEIDKLKEQLETAKKDSSLGNRKKIAELEKQLEDAQKELEKIVDDKLNSDIEDAFDDAIEGVEEENDKKIEDLEKEWTDSKIAEAIKNALDTGLFTDLDGNITNLQDAMLDFAESSGEALGIMGDVIKSNLIANLNVALDTLKNYADISDKLGLNNINSNLPTANGNSKSVTTGDININVTTQSGANGNDIAKEVKKAVNEALEGAVQGL